ERADSPVAGRGRLRAGHAARNGRRAYHPARPLRLEGYRRGRVSGCGDRDWAGVTPGPFPLREAPMSTQDRRTLRINITILEQRIVKMVEDRSAVRTGIDVARQRGRLADLDLLRRTYVQLS